MVAGHYIFSPIFSLGRPARWCGRQATCNKTDRPDVVLALCTLPLWGNIHQTRDISGVDFVGERCPPFPPPFHPLVGPYNQLVASLVGVRKIALQASIHKAIFIPLISLKTSKSLNHHFFYTTTLYHHHFISSNKEGFSKAKGAANWSKLQQKL